MKLKTTVKFAITFEITFRLKKATKLPYILWITLSSLKYFIVYRITWTQTATESGLLSIWPKSDSASFVYPNCKTSLYSLGHFLLVINVRPLKCHQQFYFRNISLATSSCYLWYSQNVSCVFNNSVSFLLNEPSLISLLWKCLMKIRLPFEFTRKIKSTDNLRTLGLNEEYDNIMKRNGVSLKH